MIATTCITSTGVTLVNASAIITSIAATTTFSGSTTNVLISSTVSGSPSTI
jgi:hypothetical protein